MACRAHAVCPGPQVLPDPADGDRSVAVHDAGVGGHVEECARGSERDPDPYRRRSVLAWRGDRPDVFVFEHVPGAVPPGPPDRGEPGRTSTLRELPVTLDAANAAGGIRR